MRIALLAGSIAVFVLAGRAPAFPQATPDRSAAPTRDAPADGRLAEATRALEEGDAGRAFELASAYLAAHPGDPEVRLLLARIHIERGELDEAYREVERALRANPRDVDALYYQGLVTGRLAAQEFERLVQRAPDSARVHQLKAETLEAQERRSEAEAEYEAALRAKPDLLEALLALGRLKRIRLECDGALALYRKADAITPTFEAAYGQGVCHSHVQDHEAAAGRFARAVALDPSAAVAWTRLGMSLIRLGRPAEGIEKLEKAIAIEPAMDEAHYLLGLAYNGLGDTARATAAFKKAEELRAGRR